MKELLDENNNKNLQEADYEIMLEQVGTGNVIAEKELQRVIGRLQVAKAPWRDGNRLEAIKYGKRTLPNSNEPYPENRNYN